ncbi:MAG: bifunctional glutamate N-acetyltransferase/amino-acid acetyltransferase ArgJ [Gammaproteobacteria bacterium]|nr:bifunctional glutamate N-acetyltransferase/amino-acid acetyltransferase ArgJ [Gammaproteobacteria bacterium]
MSETSNFSPSAVHGIRIGCADAGIRYRNRDDLVLVEIAAGSVTAATFTSNRFRAAPVLVAQEYLDQQQPRYLVINAGNANAGTGSDGVAAARKVCGFIAAHGGCNDNEVLPFSTGVIGQPLPVERIEAAVPAVYEELAIDGWRRASRAIMTTDTVPKTTTVGFVADGKPYVVSGIAKGAGMICPNMATMLAFLATDAPLSAAQVRECIESAVAQTFNCITVDGDTSTNDAAVLIATGLSNPDGPRQLTELQPARDAVMRACMELAHAIIRDAEGASKFISIEVTGGASEADCKTVAYTVAHSPLVKTALYASDPNWGRILAAVGRAPIKVLDVGKVTVAFGEQRILTNGEPDPEYHESLGVAALQGSDIDIRIDLGLGKASSTVWTCDLSEQYVRINADYRS